MLEPIGHRAKAIYPHPVTKRRWLRVRRGSCVRTYKNVTRASWRRFVKLSLRANCEHYPDTYDVLDGDAWK
jgi:hypothetical protein